MNQNFAATLKTYSISGAAKNGASALNDVTMTLTSPTPAGFAPRTLKTSGAGSFSFTSLPVGRTYTLKATKTGYNFTPASKNYTNLSANQASQLFTAIPLLSVNDVSITEGNSGMSSVIFTVKLLAPSTKTVTVKYATANGTATTPADYTALPLNTLTFTPGQTTKTISVAIKGDTVHETNEYFFVNLSAAANAIIADGQGKCTILNGTDLVGESSAPSNREFVDAAMADTGVMLNPEERELILFELSSGSLSREVAVKLIAERKAVAPDILLQYFRLLSLCNG